MHVIKYESQTFDKEQDIVFYVEALCWDYEPEDHNELAKLQIFETLLKGNGDMLHLCN